MKILLVHGVGYPEVNRQWSQPWRTTIQACLEQSGFSKPLEYLAVPYDLIFQDNFKKLTPLQKVGAYPEAVGKLLASSVGSSLSHLFQPAGTRGFGDAVQSHAGIVAQWIVNQNDLRAQCRNRIFQDIDQFQPDIICAHSLGTLLCYDLFVNDPRGDKAVKGRTFLTFGSQIANSFVSAEAWAGRIRMINADFWYHLYNPHDPVFTADIKITDARFQSLTTSFGGSFVDLSAHSPVTDSGHVGYLDHPVTKDVVWRALSGARSATAVARSFSVLARASEPPADRALLIGINDYPDPANRLEGCVNDVFRISEVLQERGFAAENIRVLLNERATKDTIVDRLHWLLDDAQDGHKRFLFYSGHGAQMPQYGVDEKVDHVDECLVPYDFDWTAAHAVTDKDFYSLYSQLPYETHFLAMFDCCHSGGLTRDGGGKVRGISPPDDIRHRLLEWNSAQGTWQPRGLKDIGAHFGKSSTLQQGYVGISGAVRRLGRAISLRQLAPHAYDQTRTRQGHDGPYLPLILEACEADELSYEYRHGATSYGAFTYCLTENLRRLSKRGSPTYDQLVKATQQTLATLSYRQTPQLVGPRAVKATRVVKIKPGSH